MNSTIIKKLNVISSELNEVSRLIQNTETPRFINDRRGQKTWHSGIKVPERVREEIAEALKEGKRVKEIAKITGVSPSTIQNQKKSMGLVRPYIAIRN